MDAVVERPVARVHLADVREPRGLVPPLVVREVEVVEVPARSRRRERRAGRRASDRRRRGVERAAGRFGELAHLRLPAVDVLPQPQQHLERTVVHPEGRHGSAGVRVGTRLAVVPQDELACGDDRRPGLVRRLAAPVAIRRRGETADPGLRDAVPEAERLDPRLVPRPDGSAVLPRQHRDPGHLRVRVRSTAASALSSRAREAALVVGRDGHHRVDRVLARAAHDPARSGRRGGRLPRRRATSSAVRGTRGRRAGPARRRRRAPGPARGRDPASPGRRT